jgi:membrane protein implicated in regulation of membrane protease activity
VRVQRWNDDGTARVFHRGTDWDAELATPYTPRNETLYIVATRGSKLVLSDRPPPR